MTILRLVEAVATKSRPSPWLGAASAAFAGQLDVAQKLASRLMRVDPAFRVSRLEDYLGPYRPAEFPEKYKQGLRKAGLPE
jgi:adenylate cyclase